MNRKNTKKVYWIISKLENFIIPFEKDDKIIDGLIEIVEKLKDIIEGKQERKILKKLNK
ncbi:MAG: hypothetical protein ACFE9V_18780 [Candidatus Hodarchaeota archaeon]